MLNFSQTIWIPLGVTVIAYFYILYEYKFSPIEPEANPRFVLPFLVLLIIWGSFISLWIILIVVEAYIIPFISWLSCACAIF